MVRLHSEAMEELVKSLIVGEDFYLNSSLLSEDDDRGGQVLSIRFESERYQGDVCEGQFVSPIDGMNLDGTYHYGLVRK